MTKNLAVFLIITSCLSKQLYANDNNDNNTYENFLKDTTEYAITHNPPININGEERCLNILEIFMCNPIGFCNPFNRPIQQLKDQLTRHYRLGPNKMSEYPENYSLQAAVLQHYDIQMEKPKAKTCCGKTMDYQDYHDRLGACCWTCVLSSMLCCIVDPVCGTISCATASCMLCAQRTYQLKKILIKQKK